VQGLTISVADLLGRPGEYREFQPRPTIEGVSGPLARLESAPLRCDLRAESVVEGILVTGTVVGGTALECARCLKPFSSELELELIELFAGPGHEGEDDAYRVTGKEIHLEPMLRDALTLALPLNPLCREDCKGLCAVCGGDLNSVTCDCTTEAPDPRWAELTELKERLGG
jgi:uncharacterized protein